MTTAPNRPETKANPKALGGLLPFVARYKGRVALALVFLTLAAASALAFPVALRYLVDAGLAPDVSSPEGKAALVQQHFLALFAVAAALGVFSALRFYCVSWLGERITADLRNAVYGHVLRQSPEFYETTQTGEVLSRLTADTTLVQTIVGSSLSMGLRNLVMGLGALLALVVTNPRVMLTVGAVLALIVLPSLWFGRRVRKLSRSSQDRVADTSAIASEVLGATATVQSFTAEARETARFEAATETAFKTADRRSKTRAALIAFIIICTSAALLAGLYQGTQAVMAGRTSAGELSQTVLFVIILASAFAVLGEVYGDVQRAAGATERLMELLHSRSPVRDEVALTSNDKSPFEAVKCAQAAIDLIAIDFHYPSRPNAPTLHQLSLQVAAGETVALVGASGAGKTTVFQLLQRFYDPQGGELRVAGLPVRGMSLAQLRSQIAVVSQESVVFSASALENIRYGRPDATQAEVHAAAKAAFAHEFLMALPDGYNTFLGERGVRLSGGQKQRIAIARALLKNAPILLLDEATSALDAESERVVQEALDNIVSKNDPAAAQRTTLVIAHRLATVQKADRIVFLEAGRLVEQGTHAQLVVRNGPYAKLAALQFAVPGQPSHESAS